MLTHLDGKGRARMVDVGGKEPTARRARAYGEIRMKPAVLRRLLRGGTAKGDALAVANIAGILLGLVENIGIWFIPSGYKDAIAFVILIIFLLFKPNGLFGAKQEEDIRI